MFLARRLAFVGVVALAGGDGWAQNILSNTDHIALSAVNAVSILGGTNIVDQTCPTGTTPGVSCFSAGGPTFESNAQIIADAGNTGVGQYLANTATPTGTPNAHAPYKVINRSSTGWSLQFDDQAVYTSLTTGDLLFNKAYCGAPTATDYPPVAASNVLPNNAGAGTIGVQSCGYAVGIEFSMTAGYKGFDTGSPSGATEAMSAMFAVLRANHPAYTWGDVKGALRQSASNWATGYAASATNGGVLGFGYGNVNYDGANAVASTASIYLQPPGFAVVNHAYYAILMLYPFLTTRRVKEVIYAGGTWPAASAGNELTAAQVTAAGGTKVADSGGAAGPQAFTYSPLASGSVVFTALTVDAGGNASRVETIAQSAQSFVVGTACLQ